MRLKTNCKVSILSDNDRAWELSEVEECVCESEREKEWVSKKETICWNLQFLWVTGDICCSKMEDWNRLFFRSPKTKKTF